MLKKLYRGYKTFYYDHSINKGLSNDICSFLNLTQGPCKKSLHFCSGAATTSIKEMIKISV